MAKRKEVVISITKKGITTDFSGFKDKGCFDVAEEIRRKLAKLGVSIEATSAEPKDDGGPDGDGTRINNPLAETEKN